MTGWRWWVGPWSALDLCFLGLGLVWALANAVGTGRVDPVRLGTGFWLVLWASKPFEYDEPGRLQRPDPPSGRVALAGAMFACACGMSALRMMDLVPASSAVDVQGAELWFPIGVGVIWGVWLHLMPAYVPRPANWVLHYHRERRARMEASTRSLAQARVQLLQAQLQPHFLFNALNTAAALMQEDPQRGRDVVVRLRGLLERTWKSVDTPMTTLGREVQLVQDQLAIERERFRDRLRVRVTVPASLLTHEVPALSLQPLVENALKHGIARSIDGGDIVVAATEEKGYLCLSVRDSVGALDDRWTPGTGLSNIRERLAALYGDLASVHLLGSGHATTAELRIPLDRAQPRDASVPEFRQS